MESRIKIGEVITIFDKKNSEHHDYPVIGINRDKSFMPTVANLDGVDLSKYKIVTKGTFVFSGMQTGRDVCIRIGLYDDEEPALISPAYTTFVVDEKKGILPEYFFMFFNRDESDRYGWFISDSSVRSNLDLPRFLDIEIPLPSIDEQRKVVNAWRALREIKFQNEKKAEPLMQVCQSFIQELKHKYPLQEIGPFIEECDERNASSSFNESNLRGVTSEGIFDFSKAKTQGIDFSKYKIVQKNNFAYNPSRINLGSIAINNEESYIISPMYIVFKVKNESSSIILPDFLNIYFRRKEFLRSTLFYASGSVRDTFSFKEMQRVRVPLPPIDIQQAIINIYNCAKEAKQIAAEADRLSRDVCPMLIQHVINQAL